MDNVALVLSGLPSSRCCHMIGLPDSSDSGTSLVYLLYKDNSLAYSLEFNVISLPKFVEMRSIVFPSPPLEIFALASYHCALLEDGSIYRIPYTVGNAIATVQKVGNVTTEGNTQVDLVWPKATLIPESCRFFQDKSCRSVCTLGNAACMLFYDSFHWSVNIYIFNNYASNKHKLRLLVSVDLPSMSKKPCMVSFMLGDGENELDSQLCKCIFGSELPLHCEGVVLVAFFDGDVFFIPVVSGLLKDTCALPLFCFHEPVIRIQKVLVKTDISRNEVGILFVGISGKVIILSKSKNKPQEKGPSITEFHVPGPIHLWSGCEGIAFHTDGSSLWKTSFKNQNDREEDSNIISCSTNECIRACGICLFNHEVPSPSVLLYAENGNLIFSKICDKSSFVLPAYLSTLNPLDLKELLTSIHESSEQLSKIYQKQEEKKKILSELSCAAHLILNDKVRNNFTVVVIPEWTSAKKNQIIVTVKLENKGDFNIVGNHWHFVCTVTTASGRYLSKSVPLNGLETGHKVDAKIRITVGDIVTNNDLPFAVSGGLQLFLDDGGDKVANVHLEDVGYKSPVSFFVKLTETSLNELSFLNTSIDAQFNHCDPSVSDALWELARSQQAMVFHDLENILQVPIISQETPIFNFVAVKKSNIEKLMRKQEIAEGSFLTSFLTYIVNGSKIIVPNGISEVELSIFGHKVKLVVLDDGINIQIKIIVWCHSLLPKLRFAILQKLKLINYHNSDTTVSKQQQIKGFVLKPTLLKSCLTLNSRLLQLPPLQQETWINLVSHIYAEMRELVSSELPFV